MALPAIIAASEVGGSDFQSVPQTTSGDEEKAREDICVVQELEWQLDPELSELLEQVDLLNTPPSVPTIIVSQDPGPGSSKTLYDDEASSDEEVGSDLDTSSASKNSDYKQKEIVQLQERLVKEIAASQLLKQQLRSAKEIATTYIAKFEALEKEHNDLLMSYKMETQTKKDCRGNKEPGLAHSKDQSGTIADNKVQVVSDDEMHSSNEMSQEFQSENKSKILKSDLQGCKAEEKDDHLLDSDGVTTEIQHDSKLLFSLQLESDISACKTCHVSTKKDLKEKLATQEQLREDIERLQKECASLRLHADEHRQICQEALKILHLVQTNHINKSRALQDYQMLVKVQEPSITGRENPEGQSVEDKDFSAFEPPVISGGFQENAGNHDGVPWSSMQQMLQAITSTHIKASDSQEEAESLRQKLQQSRQKSAERAQRISELQSELLNTRDLNLNTRMELQLKEKQLSEIAVEKNQLKEESSKLKQNFEDLSSKNSYLTNELSNISSRAHKYKEKLAATRKELNLLRVDHENQRSLLASVPALHAKLVSDETELRKLTERLREKEEHERKSLAMLEQERKILEEERLAWNRSIEARLTSRPPHKEASCSLVSSEQDAPVIIPIFDVGDVSERVRQSRPFSAKIESTGMVSRSHERKRERKSDLSQLWIDSSTANRCSDGSLPRMPEKSTRALSSSIKQGQKGPPRRTPSGSCMEWTRPLASKDTRQQGDIAQPIRPRVLLWGNKTEPARTLIAVSDRAVIKVSQCKGSASKTDSDVYGTIRFLGPVRGMDDKFCIGVELDLPVGDHDGKWEGVRYFRCAAQHGVWARLEDIDKIIPFGTPEVSSVP